MNIGIMNVEENAVAWGGSIDLLPLMDDIPESYRKIAEAITSEEEIPTGRGYGRATKWVEAAYAIGRLRAENVRFTPKEGTDEIKAIRHFHAAVRAKGAEGAHRLAGAAYLLSTWFKDVEYNDRVVR